MIAEPWLSVDQIAEHLGVKRASIYRGIDRKGRYFHVKFLRARRFAEWRDVCGQNAA